MIGALALAARAAIFQRIRHISLACLLRWRRGGGIVVTNVA
jgi:hypothetical protein